MLKIDSPHIIIGEINWGDQQSLEQAVLVAKDNRISLEEIERWSKVEDKLSVFHVIRNRLEVR